MEFRHIPVLPESTIAGLNIRKDGIYLDGTLGGGGHTRLILSADETCRVIGVDRDTDAIAAAKEHLKEFAPRVTFVNDNFRNAASVLDDLGIDKIDGAILDLGVSSFQLDNAKRGFSYMHDAPLDMRMDQRSTKSAREVINGYSAEELTRIFYEYGEERWSKKIAAEIVNRRARTPIETTSELVSCITSAIPAAARREGGHPAKRVFQAVRIEVNDELGILKKAVSDIADKLSPAGRICVITFHSLEDRMIKQAFASLAEGCTCPKDFPVCVCGKKPVVKLITKKPITAEEEEISRNPRAKSAKLRIAEKL